MGNKHRSISNWYRLTALVVLSAISSGITRADSGHAPSDKPFAVEYYYTVKWGFEDEFLQLYKKNHYPVLLKELEMGVISKFWMDQPVFHTTEDGRWTFRTTMVFKNAESMANEPEAELQKQLFPDQVTFKRDEQRRFEILAAHWDLPIKAVDLKSDAK